MNKDYKHKIKKSSSNSDIGGGLFKGGSLYLPPNLRGYKNTVPAKEFRAGDRYIPDSHIKNLYAPMPVSRNQYFLQNERIHDMYAVRMPNPNRWGGWNLFPCFGIKTKLDVSIILPDDSEDELEIELCCGHCAGLTHKQFNWLFNNRKPIKIDSATKEDLILFVKKTK